MNNERTQSLSKKWQVFAALVQKKTFLRLRRNGVVDCWVGFQARGSARLAGNFSRSWIIAERRPPHLAGKAVRPRSSPGLW